MKGQQSAPGRLLASVREETASDPNRAKRMQEQARECERRWRERLARERGIGGTG